MSTTTSLSGFRTFSRGPGDLGVQTSHSVPGSLCLPRLGLYRGLLLANALAQQGTDLPLPVREGRSNLGFARTAQRGTRSHDLGPELLMADLGRT